MVEILRQDGAYNCPLRLGGTVHPVRGRLLTLPQFLRYLQDPLRPQERRASLRLKVQGLPVPLHRRLLGPEVNGAPVRFAVTRTRSQDGLIDGEEGDQHRKNANRCRECESYQIPVITGVIGIESRFDDI